MDQYIELAIKIDNKTIKEFPINTTLYEHIRNDNDNTRILAIHKIEPKQIFFDDKETELRDILINACNNDLTLSMKFKVYDKKGLLIREQNLYSVKVHDVNSNNATILLDYWDDRF